MIIDTHQHLGRSMYTGVDTTESDLIAAMEVHGVSCMLIMPQPTLEPIPAVHDRIAAAAAAHSGRIFGMASINPWVPEAEYEAEARRCLAELGFVALKLHPLAHNLPPNAPEADKIFRLAEEHGVPVIVHTGLGAPWALPSLIIPPARRYPTVRIVLAHAGWGLYSDEAVVAADLCPNVYLEPSWCPAPRVRKMVDRLGADRVLFGSDHLTNLPVELTKYRSIGLAPAQVDAVLGGTAAAIFPIGIPAAKEGAP